MDAERIARLYRDGQITGPQILRAAAMGLIPLDAVPAGVGDAVGFVARWAEIRGEVQNGMDAIRTANGRLDAVIAAAAGIEAFAGTSLTQAQIISTLKQLATGVRLVAEGEKLALDDIDYLARLQLGLVDLTGGPGPINPG